MKIEYLESGSSDCPLIRLYAVNSSSIRNLKVLLENLAHGRIKSFQLDDQDFVESINGCRLLFEIGAVDKGIIQTAKGFSCVLRNSSYHTLIGLLEPFLEDRADGYQWLDQTGDIALLLSVTGEW